MDAHAHLLSLGWAGPGHALDSRPTQYKQTGKRGLDYDPKANTGTGLIKPLMISQRKERFGIGKKDPKHEPAAGNGWWLKGFETALGNVGKSESERSGTSTPVMGTKNGYERKHAGLYGFFVKGREMEGTIGEEMLKKGRKRKSGCLSDEDEEEKEEEEEGETEKPKDGTDVFVQTAAFIAVRDRDEKRRTRTPKARPTEEFEQAMQFFGARSRPESVDAGGPVREETKEERRARRRKRKEEKAKKARAVAEGGDLPLFTSDDTSKRKSKGGRRGKGS